MVIGLEDEDNVFEGNEEQERPNDETCAPNYIRVRGWHTVQYSFVGVTKTA
jgi:hypothetical protein